MSTRRKRAEAGDDDDEDESDSEKARPAKRGRSQAMDPELLRAAIIVVRPRWQAEKQGSLKQDEVDRMLQLLGYESSDLAAADAQVRKYFHANKFHEVIEVDAAVSSNKDIKKAINKQRPSFQKTVVADLDDAAILSILNGLEGITREGLLAHFARKRLLQPGVPRVVAVAGAAKRVRGVGKATSASIMQRNATASAAIAARAVKEAETLNYQTANKPIQERLIEELETYELLYSDDTLSEIILAGGDSESNAEKAIADLKRVINQIDLIRGPELVDGISRISIVIRCQSRLRLIAHRARYCNSSFGRDHTCSVKVQSAEHPHQTPVEVAAAQLPQTPKEPRND